MGFLSVQTCPWVEQRPKWCGDGQVLSQLLDAHTENVLI